MRFDASVTAITLLAALLSGCASTGGQGPATESLAKLVPGKATAAEVRQLLGAPLRVSRFDRMQRDVWEYRRYEDPTDIRNVAVQFSADGIVREVLVVKDYANEPCGP